MVSMALAGNVETIGLSSIFLFISTNNLSGLFSVKSDDGELNFCFHKGDIFFPKDERRTTYTLAGMLRKTGSITKQQLLSADDESLEQMLLTSGSATEDDVTKARRMQFEEEIYDLFMWRRPFFEFRPGGEPEKLKQALQTNNGYHFKTQSVLMEAARRADDLERIKLTIPSMKVILEINRGQEEAIDKSLAEKEIDGSHRSFDGITPVNVILKDWKVPYTIALGTIASLIERKALLVVPLEKSVERAGKCMTHQRISQAIREVEHQVEAEPRGPNRLNIGAEGDLIKAQAFKAHNREFRCEAKFPGARVFKLLKLFFAQNRPFTLIIRQDEHEKRISRFHHQVAISSTKRAATPKLIHYLQRCGAVNLKEAKALWKASGKQLYGQLIGTEKISKDQWLEALGEKVCEELVEVFFWKEPQVEIINKAQNVTPSRRPMKITLPLNENTSKQIVQRLKEFAAMIRMVPSEDTIFFRRHPDLPPPHPFYKRFDSIKPLRDIREHARAGPLEFFRFVYTGVSKRILRAGALNEFIKGITSALDTGDHRSAIVYSAAVRAFELQNLVPELLERVERETQGLDLSDNQDRLGGDLIHFSLAEVLQTLTQGALSGTLKLSSGKQEQTLYFFRGQGYLLKIEEDLSESNDFLEIFGNGSESEDFFESFEGNFQATESLELENIREELLNVFFWKEAKFEFTRNSLPNQFWESGHSDTVKRIPLDTQSFLMSLLNKLRYLDDIRKMIPNEQVLVEFVSMDRKMEAMGSNEFPEVVMIIDGRHNVEQLARTTSATRYDLYMFLYQRLQDGALRLVRPPDFAKAWDEGDN
jgi:hypothetical protein